MVSGPPIVVFSFVFHRSENPGPASQARQLTCLGELSLASSRTAVGSDAPQEGPCSGCGASPGASQLKEGGEVSQRLTVDGAHPSQSGAALRSGLALASGAVAASHELSGGCGALPL